MESITSGRDVMHDQTKEGPVGNGHAQASGGEHENAAADAESVAAELIMQLGRRAKDLAGRMREESLHQAFRNTTNTIADTIETAGGYLEERRFENVVDDVVAAIRKYPVPSVLLGVTVGLFLARRGK
jgi:hypothetical protein